MKRTFLSAAFAVSLFTVTLFLFQNCSQTKMSDVAGSGVNVNGFSCSTIHTEMLRKIRYFNGGFYTYGDMASYTHDFTVDLTTGLLQAKDPTQLNSDCTLTRTLTGAELTALKAAVLVCPNTKSTGPMMVDGGYEVLQSLTNTNAVVDKVYLNGLSAPAGEYVFESATLSNRLKALTANSELFQRVCVTQ